MSEMMNDNNKRHRRKNKNDKRGNIKFSLLGKIIICAVLAVCLYIGSVLWLPNFEKIPFYEFFSNVEKDRITIILKDNIVDSENSPVYMENEIYLPVDFVKQNIDEYIFWDENENKLTITTEKNVIRMQTDELTYYVNDEPMELDMPIYNIESVAYVPAKTLEDLYNIKIEYKDKFDIVTVDYTDESANIADIISSNAIIRYEADIKSPITQKLAKGDTVIVFDSNDNGEFTKVRTPDGLIGWVKTKAIGQIQNKPPEVNSNISDSSDDLWKPEKGKINMVFDQITKVEANTTEKKRTYHDGVDVLSPTWFSFLNEQGDIKNIADKSYVEWAKSHNYQVWGLIKDNFDSDICHAVLSSTKTREHVIKQILAYTALYDLDGINIDFEALPKGDGEYFVQFIRELTPLLHKQGVLVSADFYVPKPWTKHYNRGEVAKIADYLIVMGYDQHYAGSEQSGSVATLDWSREAIQAMIDEGVPKEKIILGVPFYTRIWEEKMVNGEIELSSGAYGMQQAYDFMNKKNAEIVWLEDAGQYYGEVTEGDTTYKVWFEDEKSFEGRLNLINEYDVAGCAAWRRGLEKDGIWEVAKKLLK